MPDRVKPIKIFKRGTNDSSPTSDLLVVEEPLEIRIGYGPDDARLQHTLTITMRTPGDDEHLCLGFMYNEAVINKADQVLSAKYCSNVTDADGGENIMRVELRPDIDYNPKSFKRNFYTNSSCGVCGKASIEQVEFECSPIESTLEVSEETILKLPSSLLSSQDIFKHTGGVHACGLYTGSGELIAHKEDVGRHNALDKLIGAMLLANKLPANKMILMLSGRISFELVQKAIVAGIPIIVAVGAPSSLAVDLAQQFGVTMIGFIKESGFNIYSNEQRIIN